MTKLAPSAEGALSRVKEKQLAYKVAKERLSAELAVELEQRLESFSLERDQAVVLADQAGVPRTQIGKALGTSNYRTVQAILENAGVITRGEGADEFSNWSIVPVGSEHQLTITNLGDASVSGSALVKVTEDYELVYVSGDGFVVPQVYRSGVAEDVIKAITGA